MVADVCVQAQTSRANHVLTRNRERLKKDNDFEAFVLAATEVAKLREELHKTNNTKLDFAFIDEVWR